MNKFFSIFAALLLASTTLLAETIDGVKYIDADGLEKTANNVTEITNASATLAGGWYVVYGSNVQTGTLVCEDAVHIIIADGAKLTATGNDDFLEGISAPGIQVSGMNNFLTIYGQAAQTGQLVANGGYGSAGIGSKQGMHLPTNITINGAIVTANGSVGGAGIGGGSGGDGSNITINGGIVTANGGNFATGIGGGENGHGSDIYVDTNLVVKADTNNPPTTVIENDGSDLASKLDLRPYVTVSPGSLSDVKDAAIAAINTAIEGVTDSTVLAIANKAKTDIDAAETVHDVNFIEAKALTDMNTIILNNARTAALNAIEAAADSAKAEIDSLSTYPAADAAKLKYKAKINEVVAVATDTINNVATTVVRIDDIRNMVVSLIDTHKEEAKKEIGSINKFEDVKANAIKEITDARQGIQNTEINQWTDAAINDIRRGSPDATPGIEEIKEEILTIIKAFKDGKAEGIAQGDSIGYARGKTEALGSMAEPCENCTVIEVKKGDKVVTLYAPDQVTYKKEE